MSTFLNKSMGYMVKHLNLFDLLLEYLKSRNLLDKAIQVQRQKGDEALKKALAGPLHETKMSGIFAEAAQPAQHDLVIVSQVSVASGHCFVHIRCLITSNRSWARRRS